MLIIGIDGLTLTADAASQLRSSAVCGVILFSRNFQSRQQIVELIGQIRALRPPPFLITVDQEGGPVQRFREGFSALPALATLGAHYEFAAAEALALAERHAWLMASEMLAVGIDLSFAPVVDLKRGNRAIGERAFHADPAVVAAFAAAYVRGLATAGMAATLKHFPGHGSVREDTHFDVACDPRAAAVIEREDLYPFRAGIAAGAEAVMMAHVSYPAVCAEPAGYSRHWIQQVLRSDWQFDGMVFSDDIGMAAAESVGGIQARIDAHLDAGCDIVLVCAPSLVAESISAVASRPSLAPARLAKLSARKCPDWVELTHSAAWRDTQQALRVLTSVKGLP